MKRTRFGRRCRSGQSERHAKREQEPWVLGSFSLGAILGPALASVAMMQPARRAPLPTGEQEAVTGDGAVPPVGPGLDPRVPSGGRGQPEIQRRDPRRPA